MSNEKLKPCPLCGCEDVRTQESYQSKLVRIFCTACGLSTVDRSASERNDLIEYWNERTSESALKIQLAELESELKDKQECLDFALGLSEPKLPKEE